VARTMPVTMDAMMRPRRVTITLRLTRGTRYVP
jgi:hypothetical protein